MSIDTATQTAPKRLFAELLEERYIHADESQADVAAWLNDFMDSHDLDVELAEIERTAPDDLRDATMDAIAVIKNYRASNAQAADYHVGQAAVSKWKNRDPSRRKGSSPTPEKWVALARYMGLPLAELHRLIVFGEMPESVIALQHRLASATKMNRDLHADLERLRAELDRATRAQKRTDEDLVRLRSLAGIAERGEAVPV